MGAPIPTSGRAGAAPKAWARSVLVALLGLGLALGAPRPAAAQPDAAAPPSEPAAASPASGLRDAPSPAQPADANLMHVVGDDTFLYNRSDSTAPVQRLAVRTPLHRRSCRDNWCRVRTDDGEQGYVPREAVSNVWIRVSKAQRRVYLYRGPRLADVFEADLAYNTFADKKRRGSTTRRDHYRTPEGVFYVVHKNPSSTFYKALVLNYPKAKDARRGLRRGLISQAEHDAIVEAQRDFRMPPMDTALGGWIEIHGEGTGAGTAWTQGCVAVQNQDMNRLWAAVAVGTPVLIE